MKTEILVINDRSGSMDIVSNEVIGGYNAFLKDQQSVPGEAKITYTQFDNHYEVVYQGIDINDAPLLTPETYQPRGGTALLDALGRTLNTQGKRIKDEAWADCVIVCVTTDGFENASHEYTRPQIQEMVKHAEANGWKFVFLFANQDAFEAAQSYGSSGAYAKGFVADSVGTQASYAMTSGLTRSLRTA